MIVTPPPEDGDKSAPENEARYLQSLSPSGSEDVTSGEDASRNSSFDAYNSNNNMGCEDGNFDMDFSDSRGTPRGRLQRGRRVDSIEETPGLDYNNRIRRGSNPVALCEGGSIVDDHTRLDNEPTSWRGRCNSATTDEVPRMYPKPAIKPNRQGSIDSCCSSRIYMSPTYEHRTARHIPTPEEMLNTNNNMSDADDDDEELPPWQRVFRQVSVSLAGLPERGTNLINLSPWKTLIEAKIHSISADDMPFKFLRPLSERFGIGGNEEQQGRDRQLFREEHPPVRENIVPCAVPRRVPSINRDKRVTFGPAESVQFREPDTEHKNGQNPCEPIVISLGDDVSLDEESFLYATDVHNKNNNMGEETGSMKISGPREEPEGAESKNDNNFISQEDEIYMKTSVNKDDSSATESKPSKCSVNVWSVLIERNIFIFDMDKKECLVA